MCVDQTNTIATFCVHLSADILSFMSQFETRQT